MSSSQKAVGGLSLTARAALLLACIAGISLRLLLSWVSVGSNDARTWLKFASYIKEHGLVPMYFEDPRFNHPPGMGFLSSLLLQLSERLDLSFFFLLRLPGILAECLSLLLIYLILKQHGQARALAGAAIYALCPLAIMISGFHGNTDPMYVCLLLASVYCCSVQRAYLAGGLCLGLACNIKLIPVLLVPVFIIALENWRQRLLLALGLLPGALPYLALYVHIGSVMLKNIFGWNGELEYWGLSMFMLLTANNNPGSKVEIMAVFELFRSYGRYLILGSIIACSAFLRKRCQARLPELVTLALLIFIILSPGFGIQYHLLLPAFLALISVGWSARVSVAGGFFGLCFYGSNLISAAPLESLHTHTINNKGVMFLGFLLWTLYCLAFVHVVRLSSKPASITQ